MKQTYLIIILVLSCSVIYSQQDPWYLGGSYIYESDTCDFTDTCNYVVIDTNSQWQIGTTDKLFFSSNGFSGRAAMTDTLIGYESNDTSIFELDLTGMSSFSDDYYAPTIAIGFKHKIDSDTLNDGGFITVSLDSGQTWLNLANMSQSDDDYYELYRYNIYSTEDSLLGDDIGYSGRFNWMRSGFQLTFYIPLKMSYTDPRVRFHFISDNNTNNSDGWIIDSLEVYAFEFYGSVNKLDKQVLISISPNPVSDQLTVSVEEGKGNLDGRFSLIDPSGQMVASRSVRQTNSINIDVSNFSSGIYTFRWIGNDGNIINRKIVIE